MSHILCLLWDNFSFCFRVRPIITMHACMLGLNGNVFRRQDQGDYDNEYRSVCLSQRAFVRSEERREGQWRRDKKEEDQGKRKRLQAIHLF